MTAAKLAGPLTASRIVETTLRGTIVMLAAAFLTAAALPAAAQGYPDRVVKVIHPFPGGPTDTFARILAQKFQTAFGQSVIVEGKPGAGGTIAVNAVAKSPADGYTLLVTTASTQVVQPVVRKSMPYDVEKDLIPLASSGLTPQLIVVHPSLPVTTLRELIDYAKAHPDTLSYSSSGNGTALHMAGEVFSSIAGVKLIHVPYKSAGAAVTDLLGGQVKLMFDSVANSAPYIKSGKLRGIAVMGADRVPSLPDLKTTTELGMPAMRFYNFVGVYAPAGIPPQTLDRITKVLQSAMVDADARAFYESAAMPNTPLFGAELAQASRVQRRELAEVVKKANLQLVD